MEKPIDRSYGPSNLSKLKDRLMNQSEFMSFDIKPQMPKKQVSHFVKQAVRQGRLVAIQINQGDGIISELVGTPSRSKQSHHLVIKGRKHKTLYLISGSQIRHIRYL
ncbi:Uncharacterised protein [Alloiococcus otitis]|uniref:Uncharacterized protein n=1 Tax=Alloiococcus otitis ATCC 51267 TaxID=883081 RepID=K9EY84_9LACT|nr:hypothetical protein [Alloiococcus otitis]EKU94190.1 hypothetical protein HMPREF9698_00222 [Alloiococcus otitis ATCC 51267]SUU81177.1 Uncharacterised protein [Alloiococcus otitis]